MLASVRSATVSSRLAWLMAVFIVATVTGCGADEPDAAQATAPAACAA